MTTSTDGRMVDESLVAGCRALFVSFGYVYSEATRFIDNSII